MAKTAILTDTNSGITSKEAAAMGIFLLHMTFTVNGQDYREELDIKWDKFYAMLSDNRTTEQLMSDSKAACGI